MFFIVDQAHHMQPRRCGEDTQRLWDPVGCTCDMNRQFFRQPGGRARDGPNFRQCEHGCARQENSCENPRPAKERSSLAMCFVLAGGVEHVEPKRQALAKERAALKQKMEALDAREGKLDLEDGIPSPDDNNNGNNTAH